MRESSPRSYFLGTHGTTRTFESSSSRPSDWVSTFFRHHGRPELSRPDVPVFVDHGFHDANRPVPSGSSVRVGSETFRHEIATPQAPPVIRSLVLEGISPWTAKKRRVLKGGSLVIGQGQRWLRAGGLRIQSDPHVRLVHAEIAVGGNQYYLHPYAPTFVDGKAIFSPTPLKPGQVVTVGRSSFRVKAGPQMQLKKFRPAPQPRETFSIEDQHRFHDFLRSPLAIHHPHLQETFAGANLLPEGRALRYAQMMSEIRANLDFLQAHARGHVSMQAPSRDFDFPVKHTMRTLLQRVVNQPDFAVLNFGGRRPDSDSLQLSSDVLPKAWSMLGTHRELYLKPSDSSSSFGVSRMTVQGDRLHVFSTHSGYLDRLDAVRGARRESPKIVSVPLRGPQSLFSALRHFDSVVALSQGQDAAILEAGIRIPKIRFASRPGQSTGEKPKTWEIRSFHQLVDGQGQITYQYAKVGSGSETAAIAKGGSRADAMETVRNVYRQHQPGMSERRIEQLAQRFLQSVNAETAKVVQRMKQHLVDTVGARNGQYALGKVDLAHLVVDFTGQFDDNGRLQPVLMEINKVGSLHPSRVAEHRRPHAILRELMRNEEHYIEQLQQRNNTPVIERLRRAA